jgi:hypothetical protein
LDEELIRRTGHKLDLDLAINQSRDGYGNNLFKVR